ncbi:hypothetical protein [Acidisoma cladoniae]|jgi:hypothetical protein|uniref:hypothetical protein n=1 Tax=Acidisoma cladoniae TaxID=3040935 RepID=UPI00254BE12C|nr:hypothetical protein [Acidisoma sp. PAMC 29798]
MDLSPLLDMAATLASAVLAACAPVVVLKISRMLTLNLDQTHRQAVTTALDTALGLGLKLAQEAGDARLANVNIRSAALATMVGYVKETVPAAVGHFGLTDDAIAQKAAARLASALHTLPAVAVVTAGASLAAAA